MTPGVPVAQWIPKLKMDSARRNGCFSEKNGPIRWFHFNFPLQPSKGTPILQTHTPNWLPFFFQGQWL